MLREVARRLLQSVRSYDFVGRYGGEEFMIVLNNCPSDPALARAEEIRKSIYTRPVRTDAGPLEVTMSLGLLLSTDWGHRPAEDLIHEVDSALYAAKTQGRNRVNLAKPNGPAQSIVPVQVGAERLR